MVGSTQLPKILGPEKRNYAEISSRVKFQNSVKNYENFRALMGCRGVILRKSGNWKSFSHFELHNWEK